MKKPNFWLWINGINSLYVLPLFSFFLSLPSPDPVLFFCFSYMNRLLPGLSRGPHSISCPRLSMLLGHLQTPLSTLFAHDVSPSSLRSCWQCRPSTTLFITNNATRLGCGCPWSGQGCTCRPTSPSLFVHSLLDANVVAQGCDRPIWPSNH